MTDITDYIARRKKTPIRTLNMGLVNYYVIEHRAGRLSNPALIAVAEAAIALQKAYEVKDYQVRPLPVDEQSLLADEAALEKAIARFYQGNPKRGPAWGVRRETIPKQFTPGEYITIFYKDFNDLAAAAGTVVQVFEFANAKGVVIKLEETYNGFNLREGGWKYASLWIPNDPEAQAGFLC